MIVNEECDYIVKHIKEVEALRESYALVRQQVPGWLRTEIHGKLRRRIKELPLWEEIRWEVEEDQEAEIYLWGAKYNDENHDIGIYYGIEEFDWGRLTAKKEDEGLWIYLYYDPKPRRARDIREEVKKWEEALIATAKKIRSQLPAEYRVFPRDDDKGYLVGRYLNRILNVETLAENAEQAIDKAIDLLMEFIDDTKDLMIPLPWL